MKCVTCGRRILIVMGLVLANSAALASDPCTSVYEFLKGIAASGSYAASLASAQAQHPYCFSTLTPAATNQSVVATSFNQMSAISQGMGSRLLSGGPAKVAATATTGLAAGGASGAWNAWGNYSSDTSSYITGLAAPFNFDTRNVVNNIVIGGDFGISSSMVVGLSAAFDSGSGRSNRFAAGTSTSASRGQSVAAYVGWQLGSNWAVDATLGGGIGRSDPSPGTTADSTRRFAGGNISYANWIGNWQLNGKVGYQFGAEQFDNAKRGVALPLTYYTARLGQAKIGGEVGYWLSDGVMPYVGVTYVNDVSRNRVRDSRLWDDDAVVLTAGINFFSAKNNLSGGIAYTDETNRNFVRHNNWMANINYRF